MKRNCAHHLAGFTLIELLVVVGITSLVIVSAGSIMTGSYRAKKGAQVAETMTIEATKVMEEIKKNVLEARIDMINCPVGVGESVSFTTKSGGMTTLLCNDATKIPPNQIASSSAESGTYGFLNDGLVVSNCSQFVSCDVSPTLVVSSINFNFGLGVTEYGFVGKIWNFQTKVTPRYR